MKTIQKKDKGFKAFLRRNLRDFMFEPPSDMGTKQKVTNQAGNNVTDIANEGRTNYRLMRELYSNSSPSYYFAGQLVKPIIRCNVSFIGVPHANSTKETDRDYVDKVIAEMPIRMVHKTCELEGDCFLWLQYDSETRGVTYSIIPNETIKHIMIEPSTKQLLGYIIEENIVYTKDKDNLAVNGKFNIVITSSYMDIEFISDYPSDSYKSHTVNPYGMIPVVHFKNDSFAQEIFGTSEIQNIVAQLGLYHSMTENAQKSQRRDGKPKLKVTTSNISKWVNDNFGAGTWDLLQNGGQVNLDDRDLILCTKNSANGNDDVSYIEASKSTGDFSTLAELTFSNIIEGAQTPEILMGASMGASLSSVQEQRPAYILKIKEKQEYYAKKWKEAIDLTNVMLNFVAMHSRRVSYTLEFPAPDFETHKEKMDALNVLATVLVKMKGSYMITDNEIHDILKSTECIVVNPDYEKHNAELDETVERTAQYEELINDSSSGDSGDTDTDSETGTDKNKQNRKMTDRYARGQYRNTSETKDKPKKEN